MTSPLLVLALVSAWTSVAALFVNTPATLQQLAEGVDEFCVGGRRAPKFFLIGAPKTGTTYFFEDFARSKGLAHYEPFGEPDWHAKEPWVFAGVWKVENKEEWLQHYPACEDSQDQVAVDCTPGYFSDPGAPPNIHSAYSSTLRPLLTFMVFLREPVGRTHSHYYQLLETGVLNGHFANCQPEQFPASFHKAVTALLDSPSGEICHCSCDTIFLNSFYTDAFDRYFSLFDASQFHVVPFQLAVGHEITQYAWDLLSVPEGWGDRSGLVGEGNLENHHKYPSLQDDVGTDALPLFVELMDRKTGAKAVAKQLANSEAKLFKFNRAKREGNVEAWLEENWS